MFAQADRSLNITQPLGGDTLLLIGVKGREAISELFEYELEVLWQGDGLLPFASLLGQPVTVTMQAAEGARYINGIVSAIQQGEKDRFTRYRLHVVPTLWTLTRQARSQIFQQMSVPDILNQVLQTPLGGQGLSVQLTGTYKPREYCVQYRESQFAFASRLMEEEGMFYFFQHANGSHTMVIADSPQAHQDLAVQSTIPYEELGTSKRAEDRINDWRKHQELRAASYTVRDFNFETPTANYESNKTIVASVAVGTVTHVPTTANGGWEIYDYPGDFAQRFDGVSTSGGDQTSNLNDAYSDADRVVALRMKQETTPCLSIQGKSNHAGLMSGYKFTLSEHFSDNGDYVVVSAEHDARQPIDADGHDQPYEYKNAFSAIPLALPFVPPRVTPQPVVSGVQTAMVVGNAGDEICTDKYGRVKVQFPWDRLGQNNSSSSCWLRVATSWAGTQWGAIHIPRVGHEVVVDFLEGDPDHPIIIGSVYNATTMPPYTLPDNKTQSGIHSRSTLGGGAANYNQIRFEDLMGSEQILIHAEKDLQTEVEHDETRTVGNNRTTTIQVDETKTVHGKETITIDGDQSREITQGNQTLTIDEGNQTIELKMGNQSTKLDMGNQSTELSMGNQSTNVDLGSISMEAMQSITLTVGSNSITINQEGITLNGMMISETAMVQGSYSAPMIQISGDAMTQVEGGIVMIN